MPTQPACGNTAPHRPHNGMARPIGDTSDPWCAGVEDPDALQSGDWVQVWGQVKEPSMPDEVVVEFFSKTDQWGGIVLKDRVVKAPEPPHFATRCRSLQVASGDYPSMLVRCERHEGHPGSHEATSVPPDPNVSRSTTQWAESYGTFEP